MLEETRILLKTFQKEGQHTLEAYKKTCDGYQALEKALKLSRKEVCDEVKGAALRGRGGAGFNAGLKWSFMPKEVDPERPHYLCCNADESEPGCFKDRMIMYWQPHLLIEGMLIAAHAMAVRTGYIYIRGEYVQEARRLEEALEEARKAGLLGKDILGTGFDCDIWVHRGGGAYVCGEETALLSSIEGYRGYPKVKPPFPAASGVFGMPTTINNVETLANVPFIIREGKDEYTKFGPENNHGTRIFCVSGRVKNPGVFEFPMGITMEQLLEVAGGPEDGHTFKAVIPGGSSMPILPMDRPFKGRDGKTDIDVMKLSLDYDSVFAAGSFLGAGGVMVMDDRDGIPESLLNLAHFYAHESCGQCTPCREGCHWVLGVLHRLVHGEGSKADVDLLMSITNNMQGRTICFLADSLVMPVQSYIKYYREEFEALADRQVDASANG
jgi:NADH-quinone oxidoreductase subunit F